MFKIALLLAALAAAEAAAGGMHCSGSLAFAPHAGIPLKSRPSGLTNPSISKLSLRVTRPAIASISMASPLKARRRLGDFIQKCKTGIKRIALATAATTCVSLMMPTKPVFAAANQAVVDTTLDEEIDEKEEVEIEYTGMRKLSPGENVIKYGILTGGLGAWLVYTVWLGKKEDREEEERVEAEVERIEQWKKEFIDMEDVVADDEIMDSLSKRLAGQTADDVDLGGDGTGGVPKNYDPEGPKASGGSDGSSREPEVQKDSGDDNIPSADQEKMDRLRRMMGGDPEDKK